MGLAPGIAFAVRGGPGRGAAEARNMVLAQGNGGERPTEADDACCAVAATLYGSQAV